VSIGVPVGHGVDGEGDVESELVCVAGGRLDADAGGDSGDDDLRDVHSHPQPTILDGLVSLRRPRLFATPGARDRGGSGGG
jgi:hypothetical protein